MARGNGFGGSFGDANRDGLNDDVDRRPGNSVNSASYANLYDPRNEYEYTILPEVDDRVRAGEIRDEMAYAAQRQVQSKVHFWPSVGKFIIPDNNSWAAHEQLVCDDSTSLHFNPGKYLFFDKIVAEKLNMPALTDANHPDYAKYEGLRTNLEVLRNDIIGIYLNDGSYDPGDEKYVSKIAGIADEVGEMLSNDRWYTRPFKPYISVDVANVKGVGAAVIYQHLLDVQQKDSNMFSYFFNNLKNLIGYPKRTWELPPIETTPFSDDNLAAPLPPPKQCFTDAELEQCCDKMRDRFSPKGASFTERHQNEQETAACCQK